MPTTLASAPIGSAAPMEYSPPGIQTIPSTAAPGETDSFCRVVSNAVVASWRAGDTLGRETNHHAPARTAATTSSQLLLSHVLLPRCGGGTGLRPRARLVIETPVDRP